MKSRFLTLDDRLEWVQPPAEKIEAGEDAMLCELLQECIFRADNLATALDEIGVTNRLFEELGECVAACTQYMAAMSRRSYLEVQYGLVCAEVCVTVARLCAKLPCDTSLRCASVCRSCAGRIRGLYGHLRLN